jgi:30S ribosomal protein S31
LFRKTCVGLLIKLNPKNVNFSVMGKGDKKTKKGKISIGSYGVLRKKKKKNAFSPALAKAKSVEKKIDTVEEKPVKVTAKKVSEPKKAAEKKASEPKKAPAKKAPAKEVSEKKSSKKADKTAE